MTTAGVFRSAGPICDDCMARLGLDSPTHIQVLVEHDVESPLEWVKIQRPVRDIPASDFCDKCAKVLKQYGIDSIQVGGQTNDRP